MRVLVLAAGAFVVALGWTLAAGSGRALADLVSERKPEVDFPFQRA